MRRPVSAARAAASGAALGANTLGMVLLMVPPALVKLAVPWKPMRRRCDGVLNALAERWVANNAAWVAPRCEVPGADLDRRGWYVVTCNHQCWADIFVLQKALHRRIPLLKFFLKRELLYVPVIGLAWWALDFPFVRRRSGVNASREDLASARAACARFREVPTALLNFVEGTRYTPAKAARQKSPYRHLLKPKVGGMAVALETLGDKLDGLLDVTIVYPDGPPTFWQFLGGEPKEVIVQVRRLSVPEGRIHDWIDALWREKDLAIDELMAHPAAA
jgi:1-acyl-sn-glycerol-3-phosphate acyltransferase